MSPFLNWLPEPGHEGVGGSGQFEGEYKLIYCLEVLSKVKNLVHDIFQAYYIPTDMFFYEFVGIYQYPLISSFTIHFFVNELLHNLGGWFSIGDIVLYSGQFLQSFGGSFHEDCWVDALQF